MKVNLVKIGNSQGIRLPKAVIEQCGIDGTLNMTVEAGKIILVPSQVEGRAGWEDAFASAAQEVQEPEATDWDAAQLSDFDEGEWTW